MSFDIADSAARQQALDTQQSFICEAPAGSGKTELLTQRYLALLARVQQPEEILAITFTRKASAEMRARIVNALERSDREPAPAGKNNRLTWSLAKTVLERDAELKWQLLLNPNRLQISTFDSLCAKLAKAMPLQSSLGPSFDVAEDSSRLYRDAARQLLLKINEESPWQDALINLLSHVDNNFRRAEDLLAGMLGNRDLWLPQLFAHGQHQNLRTLLEQHLQHVRDESISKLKALFSSLWHRPLIDLAAFAAANLRAQNRTSLINHCLDMDLHQTELPGSDPQGVKQWQGLRVLLTTGKGSWRSSLNRLSGFPKGETSSEKMAFQHNKQQMLTLIEEFRQQPGLLKALVDIKFIPYHRYSAEQWEVLNSLLQLLPVLAAQLQLIFREAGNVDFTEVSLGAHQALGDSDVPTDLALRLDHRIQHILVDEFQDTSFNQYNLIAKLTLGWQADDGRTLFLVGDAMQSIYGFRGANVGLFLQCKARGLGDISLTPLQLTTNFRSQAGIVHWNNEVFSRAFPRKDDIASGAVAFSPATEFHEKSPGRAVRLHCFEEEGFHYSEARTILGVVRKSQVDNPQGVVAILLRNRNHGAHILPLLKEAGVRFNAVRLEPLADQSIVKDLLALCTALLLPTNRIACLSVLRAPWCGLSLLDLEAIAKFKDDDSELGATVIERAEGCLRKPAIKAGLDQIDIFGSQPTEDQNRSLSSDGVSRLQRVLPIIVAAYQNRRRLGLRQWIEGTWIQLGGPACLQEKADIDNCERFFNLLSELDNERTPPSIDELEYKVDTLFAAPDPQANEKLQIMTIHQAKGLEFDTVIVPSLHRTTRSYSPELVMWLERLSAEGHDELLLAPISGRGGKPDLIYQYMKQQKKEKEFFENCRLLYVACTRAKTAMHLFLRTKPDSNNSLRFLPPPKNSLAHCIWDPVQHLVRVTQVPQDQNSADNRPSTQGHNILSRLPQHWQLPPLREGHLLDAYIVSSNKGDEDQDDQTIEYNEDLVQDIAPRLVGTLIHNILQDVQQQGWAQWAAGDLRHQFPFWRAQLASQGLTTLQLEDAGNLLEATVTKMQSDNNLRWIYSDRHRSQSELALSIKSKHGAQNAVLDLLLDSDDGSTWIIDFKTSRPSDDEVTADFIEREKSLYREQIRLYHHVIQRLGRSNIRCALYFPLIAEWGRYEANEL